MPHTRRASFRANQPLHVTLRLRDDVGSVRNRRGFALVRQVMLHVATRVDDCRVIHLSIQGNHLHLICEAKDAASLARAMKSFKGAFTKRLNQQLGRGGSAFSDRYHVEVLTTPTQVRNCLGYVLLNWRKHGFATGAAVALDPYSTARHFDGWREQAVLVAIARPDDELLPRCEPRGWLLREGWRRGGAPPSVWDVPSRRS